MSIRLVFQPGARKADLVRADDGSLMDDEGLETIVTIALHTDARATDEELARAGLTQRGYWFDAYDDDPALNTGSKLWLLGGRVIDAEALSDAKTWCDEALAFLVESGAASAVETEVARLGESGIGGTTRIYRPTDPRSPYTITWERYFAVE